MHIHPLWAVDRGVDTCTACHNIVDVMGNAMVPAMQLDLSDGQSDIDADHYKSYRELLTGDNRQILDANGNVIDELVQATDANGNLLFQTDANGNLILDQNGQPIPILVPVNTGAPLSVAGANATGSQPFFSRFATGGTHDGRLTDAELKLVSEWIDIGGQYYNNPFDVPP